MNRSKKRIDGKEKNTSGRDRAAVWVNGKCKVKFILVILLSSWTSNYVYCNFANEERGNNLLISKDAIQLSSVAARQSLKIGLGT